MFGQITLCLLLPIIAVRGRPDVSTLWFAAATAYLLIAGLEGWHGSPTVTLSQADEGQFQSVTYIRQSLAKQHLASASIFAGLGALIFAKSRWLPTPYPTLQVVTFWAFHLAWTFKTTGIVHLIKPPRRYEAYPDYAQQLILLTKLSNWIIYAALTALAVLFLLALLQSRRRQN